MAAPTGLGVSPTLGVRLPRPVFDAIHTAARLQSTTAAELAREAIIAIYENLLDDVELAQELQRHHDQLSPDEEA